VGAKRKGGKLAKKKGVGLVKPEDRPAPGERRADLRKDRVTVQGRGSERNLKSAREGRTSTALEGLAESRGYVEAIKNLCSRGKEGRASSDIKGEGVNPRKSPADLLNWGGKVPF